MQALNNSNPQSQSLSLARKIILVAVALVAPALVFVSLAQATPGIQEGALAFIPVALGAGLLADYILLKKWKFPRAGLVATVMQLLAICAVAFVLPLVIVITKSLLLIFVLSSVISYYLALEVALFLLIKKRWNGILVLIAAFIAMGASSSASMPIQKWVRDINAKRQVQEMSSQFDMYQPTYLPDGFSYDSYRVGYDYVMLQYKVATNSFIIQLSKRPGYFNPPQSCAEYMASAEYNVCHLLGNTPDGVAVYATFSGARDGKFDIDHIGSVLSLKDDKTFIKLTPPFNSNFISAWNADEIMKVMNSLKKVTPESITTKSQF